MATQTASTTGSTRLTVTVAGIDDLDTAGHAVGLRLRLPNADDAAAFRRRLATGAMVASIVVAAGFAAATGNAAPAAVQPASAGGDGAAVAITVEPNTMPLVEPHTGSSALVIGGTSTRPGADSGTLDRRYAQPAAAKARGGPIKGSRHARPAPTISSGAATDDDTSIEPRFGGHQPR